VTPGLLRVQFGDDVADLVERLAAFRDGAAVPDDDGVITLKLLDRLHNMRTIEYVDTGEQQYCSMLIFDVGYVQRQHATGGDRWR
jgi:(p)ppGpp synthase/HD superfamily hydrolase